LYTVARTGVVWRGYTLLGSAAALVVPLLNLRLAPSGFLGLALSWDPGPPYSAQAAPLAAGVLVAVWGLGQARRDRSHGTGAGRCGASRKSRA
jgi:hypothetical protein